MEILKIGWQNEGGTFMQQNQQAKAVIKPEFAGTDAQKVKEEIKNDVRQGKGAMTSREAGAMQD